MLETGDIKIDDAQPKDAGDYICTVFGKTEFGPSVNTTSNHTLTGRSGSPTNALTWTKTKTNRVIGHQQSQAVL